MVRIINMSHHPRAVLPEEVPLEEAMDAREFLENLCASYAADIDVLLNKLVILIDGARLKEDSAVTCDSKIYILPAATMG